MVPAMLTPSAAFRARSLDSSSRLCRRSARSWHGRPGSDDRLDARRIAGLAMGFMGVAALVGLDVGASDLGAVAEVVLVALGYALGALIIARKLSGLPVFGVIAASLALTMVAYAPVGITQLPSTLPSLPGDRRRRGPGRRVHRDRLPRVLSAHRGGRARRGRRSSRTSIRPSRSRLVSRSCTSPLTFGIVVGFVLIVLGSVLATRRTAPRKPSVALSRSPDLL